MKPQYLRPIGLFLILLVSISVDATCSSLAKDDFGQSVPAVSQSRKLDSVSLDSFAEKAILDDRISKIEQTPSKGTVQNKLLIDARCRRAEIYLGLGLYSLAEADLNLAEQSLAPLSRTCEDDGSVDLSFAQLLTVRGELYAVRSQYLRAQTTYEAALRYCVVSTDKQSRKDAARLQEARILRKRGELESSLCNFQSASASYDKAYSLIDSLRSDYLGIDVILEKSDLLLSRGRLSGQFLFYSKALSDYDAALSLLSNESKMPLSDFLTYKRAELLTQMGELQFNIGEEGQAEKLLDKGYKDIRNLLVRHKDCPKLLLAKGRLGILTGELRLVQKDYIGAMSQAYVCISASKKALDMSPESIDAKLAQAQAWGNFSKYSYCQGSPSLDSVETLNRAIALMDDIQSSAPTNLLSLKYKTNFLVNKSFYSAQGKNYGDVDTANGQALASANAWVAGAPLSAKAHVMQGLILSSMAELDSKFSRNKPIDTFRESISVIQEGADISPSDCATCLLYKASVIQKLIPLLKDQNQNDEAEKLRAEVKHLVAATPAADLRSAEAKRFLQSVTSH